MNLQQHSLKIDLNDFFWEKSCVEVVRPKGPKMVQKIFFKFYEKVAGGIFLNFCMKLQQQEVLKLAQIIILEIIWF